jgi:hypothetical protein
MPTLIYLPSNFAMTGVTNFGDIVAVRVRLPAVSGFAGSMSLKMSLAASVCRA